MPQALPQSAPCYAPSSSLSDPIHPMTAGALLAALVAGDAAEDFERADPKDSARKVLEVLRSMFAPKGVNVPAPLQLPLLALHLCTWQDHLLRLLSTTPCRVWAL